MTGAYPFLISPGWLRTMIALLEDLLEFAADVSGVAIHDRRISVLDLTGVVE